MNADEVNAALAKVMTDARAAIDALADKVRAEVIVPICREHGLRYMAGNGTAIFIGKGRHKEDTISCAWEATDRYGGRYAYLAPIFQQVIDLQIDNVQVLGFFISDVD